MENKTVEVFQISNIAETPYAFRGWSPITARDFSFDDYKKVWEGKSDSNDEDFDILEDLFAELNMGMKPDGYSGHSLSVSDIVRINDKYYYCDNFGWKEITEHIPFE